MSKPFLDPQLRQQRIAEIILSDFYEDFMDAYATALSALERHPEQANNEIRNALTHLARALSSERDTDFACHVAQASGHIQRGKRDCLKAAIIARREKLADTVRAIELVEGRVSNAIHQRLKTIEKQRYEAYVSETKAEDGVNDKLVSLLIECDNLIEHIEVSYEKPSGWLVKLRPWQIRSMRLGSFVAMPVIPGLVVAYISGVLPDSSDVWQWLLNALS